MTLMCLRTRLGVPKKLKRAVARQGNSDLESMTLLMMILPTSCKKALNDSHFKLLPKFKRLKILIFTDQVDFVGIFA